MRDMVCTCNRRGECRACKEFAALDQPQQQGVAATFSKWEALALLGKGYRWALDGAHEALVGALNERIARDHEAAKETNHA